MVTSTISLWSPVVTPSAASALLEKASVPEHSVEFMQAMSGGEAFLEGPYLFIGVGDSLLCIGYPLEGEYDPGRIRPGHPVRLEQNRSAALLGHLPPAAGTAGPPPPRPGRRTSCSPPTPVSPAGSSGRRHAQPPACGSTEGTGSPPATAACGTSSPP